MAIDTSGLIAELQKETKNRTIAKEISLAYHSPSEMEKYMTRRPNVAGNELVYPVQARVGEVTQAFQNKFTPKGSVTLTSNPYMARRIKMDFTLSPQLLIDGYTSYLVAKDEGKPETNWSFTQWVWLALLIPQLIEDRKKLIFKGKYVAPTPGTAGDTMKSLDGLGVLIANGLFHGTNPINALQGIGELEDGTEYQQLMDARNLIPVDYRYNVPMKLFMAKSRAEAFIEQKEAALATVIRTNDPDWNKLRGTQITIVGVEEMEGSKRFFITPDGNLEWAYNQLEGISQVQFQQQHRDVDILGDCTVGYGIADNSKVWTNLLDSSSSKASDELEIFSA